MEGLEAGEWELRFFLLSGLVGRGIAGDWRFEEIEEALCFSSRVAAKYGSEGFVL